MSAAQITFSHEIRGALVGSLWWPIGREAWKTFRYDLTREDSRFSEPATLREHCLHLTCEEGGDFAGGAEFGDSVLVTTMRITKGERIYLRERVTPLERCKTIADMVKPDWLPSFAEDDEGDDS